MPKIVKGGPVGFLKIQFGDIEKNHKKKQKMRILNRLIERKNGKGRPFGLFQLFQHPLCCKISKNWRVLDNIENSRKKSHSVEKIERVDCSVSSDFAIARKIF